MVFTKRERTIIVVTLSVLGILGIDRYVLTPLLDRYEQSEVRRESLQAEMVKARSLLERRELIAPRWRQMVTDGLQRDPAEAESQALHAVQDWAADAGLDLSSLKPERAREPLKLEPLREKPTLERPREMTELREITLHAAGTGSMAAVSRFLWLVETAPIPIKVKVLQLGARQEGTDNLTLQVRLSTLYLASPDSADEGNEG
jgi:hypothetical protein